MGADQTRGSDSLDKGGSDGLARGVPSGVEVDSDSPVLGEGLFKILLAIPPAE
jgi:hypothetical protein